MTDQARRPDGTGFYLTSGELTVVGPAEHAIAGGRPVDFSVTARLFGSAGMNVTLASWSTEQTDDLGGVPSEAGHPVLPLHTQPMMLNSLPSSVRVQLRTAVELHDTEGNWRLVLHFRNHAGSSLPWHAGIPTKAFGPGWSAPLADLMTIDGAVVDKAPTSAAAPAKAQATGRRETRDQAPQLIRRVDLTVLFWRV